MNAATQYATSAMILLALAVLLHPPSERSSRWMAAMLLAVVVLHLYLGIHEL